MFKKPAWPPYVAGVIIGLLQIPAFIFVDTGLGTSSSFVRFAANFLSLFNIDVAHQDYFKTFLTSPQDFWQVCLVLGIIFGAYASSSASGIRRSLPSSVWFQDFKLNDRPRYILAFLGGFLLVFGARLAGGCTSGHGLTGIGQLAISSIITVIAMFIGGIVFVYIWRNRIKR